MEPEKACPRCGRKIPWGQSECPFCSEHRGYFWSLRRNTFLALVVALLIILFALTAFVVHRYDATRASLAQRWYSEGEAALRFGRAEVALADFRNALVYSPDNPFFQLRLRQAFAATGRIPEARSRLLSLREREPGNGPVNLELARLAARQHALPQAVQFYHDAVYSEWEGDAAAQRRAVRLELVNSLLASDQKAAARAELIGVVGNLPADPNLRTQVGRLMMKTGAYDDALGLFRQALAVEPHAVAALAGAGECYFRTGQYEHAEVYLNRALHYNPHLTEAAAMRDTARAVSILDPFLPYLPEQEREGRARQAFEQAMTRLNSCAAQRGIDLQAAGGDPLQSVYVQAAALEANLRKRRLRRDSEWVANTMDLVFAIEKSAAQACGQPQGRDLALLLIARAQEGAKQ
jgi:tetratricopeptide (TPR) repeat protein